MSLFRILTASALFIGMIVSFASTTITIKEIPSTIIQGKRSGLHHPEGITFSPMGDFVVVTNAISNTIAFYRGYGGHYKRTPDFMIQGPESLLNYPHDLSFSPDGKYLAVANDHSNVICIYKKNIGNFRFDSSPVALIQGDELNGPHGVKFAPNENILAVANVWGNTVALYHFEGDQYEQKPYQILQNSNGVLNKPDGLAFSSDGELIAVASHGNNSVVIFQRIPESKDQYSPVPLQILQGEETNFCYTHSVSFYPSNNYLLVSSPAGKKTLNLFKKASDSSLYYETTPVQSLEISDQKTVAIQDQYPEEGGVKGIAFSSDGKYLGVCLPNINLPNLTILIYPIEID